MGFGARRAYQSVPQARALSGCEPFGARFPPLPFGDNRGPEVLAVASVGRDVLQTLTSCVSGDSSLDVETRWGEGGLVRCHGVPGERHGGLRRCKSRVGSGSLWGVLVETKGALGRGRQAFLHGKFVGSVLRLISPTRLLREQGAEVEATERQRPGRARPRAGWNRPKAWGMRGPLKRIAGREPGDSPASGRGVSPSSESVATRGTGARL